MIIKILPYACYTEENTTLTFYCDGKRNSRPGAKFNLNEGDDMPKWYNDGYFEDITKVVFDPSFAIARPTSTYCWFNEMYNLTSIEGIDYLNTSEVTNMAYMFSYCESLPSLDLSSFDTHHVTNMCYMFSYCSELQTVYVGDEWSTAAVTNSSGMFQGCTSIIGGMGTTYDANHVNKAYAHIDGGTSNPGYFTAKANFLRGDVNGDNQVNISDAIVLINFISNGNVNINHDAANVNGDNQVNITDAIMLINYISNGHW